MPSPFPGMDPYLEDPAFWRDFHGRYVYALSEFLLDRLPVEYDATVDEQVRLVEVPPEYRAFAISERVYPDVAVTDGPRPPRPRSGRPTAPESDTATLEPVTIEVPAEEEVHERWIEIVYRSDRSLVTVIELLSPTNKSGEGLADYQAKRRRIIRQNVNLVEIDLLVGGGRLEAAEQLPPGDYFALVSRAGRTGLRDVYGWSVRRPLPAIPVPLRPTDGSVALDLGAAFTIAYDRGHYRRKLRYTGLPAAPLAEREATWAAEVARQQP